MAGGKKVCFAPEKQTSAIVRDADVNTEVEGHDQRSLLCAGLDHLILPPSRKALVLHGYIIHDSGTESLL